MSNASMNPMASDMPSEEASPAMSSGTPGPLETPRTPEPVHEGTFPQIESILSAPEVKRSVGSIEYGSIEACEGSTFLVRTGADLVHARRAKSCLIEPETGDTVLVARAAHQDSFVLSVLVGRTAQSDSVVSVDGNLTLRSKGGRVAIVGDEAVNVTSGGEVAVNAPAVVARTMSASIFSDTLSYVGRKIEAQVDRVKVLGQALDTVIDRVSSRVKHSYRTIDQLERVTAKELHVEAEGTLKMHGKNTLVTAEKLVKFDGEQIHIG